MPFASPNLDTMDCIIFLSLSNQILEAWLCLASIESKNDVVKPKGTTHSMRFSR